MTVMGRRDVIRALGAAAAGRPVIARAQRPTMPLIGFLNGQSPGPFARMVAAFHLGLSQAGYVEGRNVAVEYRWAEGRMDTLPALAAELVRRRVDLIVATGGGAHLAAKAATSTIPIVFTSGDDAIKEGLVASFNRPGGNATGINVLANELEAKRLGLLHEMVPSAALIAVLLNPKNPNFESQSRDVNAGARAIGR